MPVFFVHDPSLGIITPLNRKFHVRAVDQADAAAATTPIHPRTEPDFPAAYQQGNTVRPGTRYDDADDAPPDPAQPLDPMSELCVRDIMSTPALCGRTTQTLQQAWETMQQYEIHHLAIVDAKMNLQGMLSSNQFLHFVLRHPGPIDQAPLTQFCGKTVLSTHPDVKLRNLAAALLEQGLDGVPVCQGGQLIGMVTYTDIIKILLSPPGVKILL